MISRFVPPPGPPRVLAAAQLSSTLGNGVFYVCSALYFTRIVGISATQLGLGLTIAGAVGMAAGMPLGHLADRFGPRRTASLLSVGAGLASATYLVVGSLLPFVMTACVYALCQRGGTAARQALLASVVDKSKLTETRAYLQTMTNAGLSVGAALGGVALHFDTKQAYLTALALDALAYLVAALVLLRVPAAPSPPTGAPDGPRLAVLKDRPFVLITAINMVMMLHIPLIDVAIPLWVATYTEAPRWIVSALMVLNTAAVVLFQVHIAKGVVSMAVAARYVRRSGMLLLASCAVFAASGNDSSPWLGSGLLLFAAALQVAGEMVQSAGAWEISFKLAPDDKQGQYQGFFGTGLAAAEMLAPLLLTALVISWGSPGWLVLGALFLLAGFAMGPAVRWAERTRGAGTSAMSSSQTPLPKVAE